LTVEWKKLPLYWLAQFAGAFGAAAVVYGVYFGVKQSSFSLFLQTFNSV
jgi:glycerol uptake facilitator-like aquaporin